MGSFTCILQVINREENLKKKFNTVEEISIYMCLTNKYLLFLHFIVDFKIRYFAQFARSRNPVGGTLSEIVPLKKTISNHNYQTYSTHIVTNGAVKKHHAGNICTKSLNICIFMKLWNVCLFKLSFFLYKTRFFATFFFF